MLATIVDPFSVRSGWCTLCEFDGLHSIESTSSTNVYHTSNLLVLAFLSLSLSLSHSLHFVLRLLFLCKCVHHQTWTNVKPVYHSSFFLPLPPPPTPPLTIIKLIIRPNIWYCLLNDRDDDYCLVACSHIPILTFGFGIYS